MMNTKVILRGAMLMILAGLVTACPQTRKDQGLSEILKKFEITVRWAQWDAVLDFISPEYLAEQPVSRLEMDRLRLFRVTRYTVRSSVPVDAGKGLVQEVEIRMFNKNQARERIILYKEYWKFDEVRKRWFLYSGLPDPTRRDY